LGQAAPDQHSLGSSQTAHERRDSKEQRPGSEQAPSAEQISQSAAEQQEPTVGEQVRARDPLQVLNREVQISPNHRQRNIYDGPIEKVNERDGTHQGEGQLATTSSKKGRWS
jgi:hypothetical protein